MRRIRAFGFPDRSSQVPCLENNLENKRIVEQIRKFLLLKGEGQESSGHRNSRSPDAHFCLLSYRETMEGWLVPLKTFRVSTMRGTTPRSAL